MESENWLRDTARSNEKPVIAGGYGNRSEELDLGGTARPELTRPPS